MDLGSYTTEELEGMLSAPSESPMGLSEYSTEELEAMLPEPALPEEMRDISKTESFGAGLADMVSFGLADELSGKLAEGVVSVGDAMGQGQKVRDLYGNPDDVYAQQLDYTRQAMKAAQGQNPKTYLGGQVAGALGTGIAGGQALQGTRVAKTLADGGRLARYGTGSALGATSGGIYGYGSGEGSPAERAKMGLEGSIYGAIGGSAGVALGEMAKAAKPLAKRALKAFKNKIGKTPVKTGKALEEIIESQEMIPIVEDSPKALSKVKKTLKQDFGEDFDSVIEQYKKGDISLAELYGKRTSSLAKGAAVYPSGRAVAEEALEPKILGSHDRLMDSVSKNISGVDSYFATADDMVKAGRAKAAPLYQKAYDIEIQKSPKLKELLSRPAGKQALIKADKIAANEGIDLTDNKNTMVLDYVKRGFDDVLEKYRDKTTGRLVLDTNGRAINELRAEFVDELKSLNPTYAEALNKSSDYLKVQDMMDKGRKALKTDSEILAKTFKNLPETEKQAYKVGLGKAIRDELSKVNESANPYRRILGTPEKQRRISSILSPEEFKGFEKSLRAEDRLFRFRNKVLSGSDTAQNLEAKKLIEAGAIDSMTGVPKQTFAQAIQQMKTKLLDGINDKTAAKISDILYETDPVEKLKIIDGLKASKDFTPDERQLVERAYSLMSNRYDALNATPALAGGQLGATQGEE